MSEDHEEDKGFTVKDRRRFSETGETRVDDGPEKAEDSPVRHPAQDTRGAQTPGNAAETRERTAVPEINLPTFVMSLSTQALLHMGEIPGPEGETTERDMTAAKQVIDILGLLREKTKGNLDANEEALFENVLYDLRMRYVELSKR